MDTLSEILHGIHLSGSLWCRTEAAAPWAMKIGTMDLAHFHFIKRGHCLLQMEGLSEPLSLTSGDLVLLPHGTEHVLGDSAQTPPVPIQELLQQKKAEEEALVVGGAGAPATLLCGYWQFDHSAIHPLLSALPKLIHLKGDDEQFRPWLETTLQFILHENKSGQTGSAVVITRLVEILFIQVMRFYISRLNEHESGWLRGLQDMQISKALSHIHASPEQPWTVATLSAAAGMSRAAFAAKFKALIGESPLQYLTRWRIYKAANYLKTPDLTLAQISEQVGYQTKTAFSKVFKRHLGTAPGDYRRRIVLGA
jgi:AraC-like DNA-binding protein